MQTTSCSARFPDVTSQGISHRLTHRRRLKGQAPSHQRDQTMSDRTTSERTISESAISWLVVCRVADIDEEDVVPFEYGGKTYAIYHTPSGFYATDGICTHENAYLAGGLVVGEIIECPRHQGRFHIPTEI